MGFIMVRVFLSDKAAIIHMPLELWSLNNLEHFPPGETIPSLF